MLTIRLSINTMSEGLLYLYDDDSDCEIEIPVEFEWDYSPAEKMTYDYQGCDEELILESIKAPFGEIEIDSIQNLDDFTEDAFECMHREGSE